MIPLYKKNKNRPKGHSINKDQQRRRANEFAWWINARQASASTTMMPSYSNHALTATKCWLRRPCHS